MSAFPAVCDEVFVQHLADEQDERPEQADDRFLDDRLAKLCALCVGLDRRLQPSVLVIGHRRRGDRCAHRCGDVSDQHLAATLELANLDIAVSGMWIAEDDGVLNPNTVKIVPGAIIPVDGGLMARNA